MWYKARFSSRYSDNVEVEYFDYPDGIPISSVERDIKVWGNAHYSMFYTDVQVELVNIPDMSWLLDKIHLTREKVKDDINLLEKYKDLLNKHE
jgi:hypothetical protein